MTKRDAFPVGASLLACAVLLALAIAWFSNFGSSGPRTLATARFRTLGGVGVGDPVIMRGVEVGKVAAIRLTDDDWVEADLRLETEAALPKDPVAIAASASLFGEWQVAVIEASRVPDDPEVRRLLAEAREGAGSSWPGTALPDIGELTAQASRIAGDVSSVTERIEGLVDSATIEEMRQSVSALRRTTDQLVRFTEQQTASLQRVVGNAAASSDNIAKASGHLEVTLSRIDSSTASGEVAELVGDARQSAATLRTAMGDLQLLARSASDQREALARIATNTDAALARLQRGEGTLGLLSNDSTLYREATLTVVQLRTLLADIQANPRKYFKFSVF